jgi:hypothetical protein
VTVTGLVEAPDEVPAWSFVETVAAPDHSSRCATAIELATAATVGAASPPVAIVQ